MSLPTEADLTIIRATAALQVQLSNLQGAVVRGEVVDSEEFTRSSNALARSLAGLRRRHRRVTSTGAQDLRSYLAERAAAT